MEPSLAQFASLAWIRNLLRLVCALCAIVLSSLCWPHFWWDVLPCCYDPLTKKSHWASSFFLLHSKHGSLSRATHYTASLRGLWTVSLPKHVFLRLPVMRLLRLLSNVLSVNPRPASPVCSGPPMAFGFTSLKSLLVLQPLVWNLTVI